MTAEFTDTVLLMVLVNNYCSIESLSNSSETLLTANELISAKQAKRRLHNVGPTFSLVFTHMMLQ